LAAVAPGADAVTQEQLLFLEAWRAVDRAYVDKKFNGQNWFKVRFSQAQLRSTHPGLLMHCITSTNDAPSHQPSHRSSLRTFFFQHFGLPAPTC
jgi:hypothetical protein